jgi:hypothetical protein
MKYIIYEGDLLPEEMHTFFETNNHKEVAFKLGVKHKIISAGFYKIGEDGKAICYGYSESLKVESRGEKDAKVFDRQNKLARIS